MSNLEGLIKELVSVSLAPNKTTQLAEIIHSLGISNGRRDTMKGIMDWAEKGKLSTYPSHYFIAGLKEIAKQLTNLSNK